MRQKIKIAVVDDHVLIRKAIIPLIEYFEAFEVIMESGNGAEFIELMGHLTKSTLPDICLLDLTLPGMSGYQVAMEIKKKYPTVKILILTMLSTENQILPLLDLGINGYLLKNCEREELQLALKTITETGSYFPHEIASQIIRLLQSKKANNDIHLLYHSLSDREKRIMILACSDMTYSEIAKIIKVKVTVVEKIRQSLFNKFNVKSRVGLALVVERNNLMHQ